MAYSLMKILINKLKSGKGKETKATLSKKANVYYAASQLSDDEYSEVMEMISELS